MIKFNEWHKRRALLAEQMPENALALFCGQVTQKRNGDVNHPFRQYSHFYYLAPITEAHAFFILCKEKGQLRSIGFFEPCTDIQRMWEGPRTDHQNAQEVYGLDEAYPLSDLEAWMESHASYHHFSLKEHATQLSKRWPKVQWQWLNQALANQRLIKSPYEIEQIRQAACITVQGHLDAMQQARDLTHEAALEGALLASFLRQGCRDTAYANIVASGENACILHYHKNNRTWDKEDLVLVDAGVEYLGYASDVTRTYPVGGRFNAAQRSIYDIVLETQLAIIDQIKIGTTWQNLEEQTCALLAKGLMKLGILDDDQNIRQFYPHSIGHYLGLDVHDVGPRKDANGQSVPLREHMVITIEPGLYIPHSAPVADRWKGIGIRIEDDILITKNGPEVLSEALPKTIDGIEQCMHR